MELDEILEMLSWESNEEVQKQGLELSKYIDDISTFLQPFELGNKCVWDNCAKILSKKTDDELQPYLVQLLEWLQDLNWPGAMIVLERLKKFSANMLKPILEETVIEAYSSKDEDKLMWLDYLSEFLNNLELKSILSNNVYLILKKHYNNWGFWYNEQE
jgi:hypothetical protein